MFVKGFQAKGKIFSPELKLKLDFLYEKNLKKIFNGDKTAEIKRFFVWENILALKPKCT